MALPLRTPGLEARTNRRSLHFRERAGKLRHRLLTPVGLLLAAMLLAGVAPARAETRDQENRLVGYRLLADSLSGESSLKWLLRVRQITLHGPAKEVRALMERISEVSKQRARELGELRKLAPDVTGKPPPSPMGDAIQSSLKGLGLYEMVFSDRTFNMRFMLLQAQATRMISVIAEQTAKIESNKKRKRWLREVSKQYEALHEDIVASVEGCRVGAT